MQIVIRKTQINNDTFDIISFCVAVKFVLLSWCTLDSYDNDCSRTFF